MKRKINPEVMKALKAMTPLQLLKAIAIAKTGNPNIYAAYIPSITKRETFEQLELFIDVALDSLEESQS